MVAAEGRPTKRPAAVGPPVGSPGQMKENNIQIKQILQEFDFRNQAMAAFLLEQNQHLRSQQPAPSEAAAA